MKNKEAKQIESADDRIRDFIQNGNNPYSFSHNGFTVEVEFSSEGKSVTNALTNYLNSK